jgi:hypothetical protein
MHRERLRMVDTLAPSLSDDYRMTCTSAEDTHA